MQCDINQTPGMMIMLKAPYRSRRFPTALALAILAIAPVAAVPSSEDLGSVQPPALTGISPLEVAYVHFANDLATAGPRGPYATGPRTLPAALAVCEKISPHATELSASWGGFQSWSFYYVQSDCFYQVALNGKAVDVCDRVYELDAPPPRRDLSRARERRLTAEECRKEAEHHDASGGEYGSEMMLALLGYSREQITAGAGGRLPEHDGAYLFKSSLLNGQGDTGEDYTGLLDLMRRAERLPDFSKSDAIGRRQLDALVPGWSSTANSTRVAVMLRCAVQRLRVGEAMSARCPLL